MSRTIINGNGWYLFGVDHDDTIQQDIEKGREGDDASILDQYIVANHSAKVELAYVVQKHNPVRAWITKDDTTSTIFDTNTNLKQRSGTDALTYRWFWDDEPIYTNSEKTLILESASYDSTKERYSTNTINNSTNIANYFTNLSVEISNSDGDKVSANFKKVVIYGSSKNSTASSDAQDTWTGELNGVLQVKVNDSSLTHIAWYRKEPDDELFNENQELILNDDGSSRLIKSGLLSENNTHTIGGDDASKVIYVVVGSTLKFVGDDATTSSVYEIYENIGAAHDPFERRNWQAVIYPPSTVSGTNGVNTWKNTTNSTLGVWVKVTEFFDTVAPVRSDDNNDHAMTAHFDNIKKQVIDMEFSKPLLLEYVNVKDFTVTITDNRGNVGTSESGNNQISSQMGYPDGGSFTVTPLSVATKRGNGKTGAEKANHDDSISADNILRIILPTYDGTPANANAAAIGRDTLTVNGAVNDSNQVIVDNVGNVGIGHHLLNNSSVKVTAKDGNTLTLSQNVTLANDEEIIFDGDPINDYPYIFESDSIKVTYSRSGGGGGTILKDTSAYNGRATEKGSDNGATQLTADGSYYGGRSNIVGNLVEDFAQVIKNNSSFDNKAPILITSNPIKVLESGDKITIKFNKSLAGDEPLASDFTITYTDNRTDTQKGNAPQTWALVSSSSTSSAPATTTYDGNSTNPPLRSVLSAAADDIQIDDDTITLKLSDYIYKNHTNAAHIVKVTFARGGESNGFKDTTTFNNLINNFSSVVAQNNSGVNNTYPTLTTADTNGPTIQALNTETNKYVRATTLTAEGPAGLENNFTWAIKEYSDAAGETEVAVAAQRFTLNNGGEYGNTISNKNEVKIVVKNKPTFTYEPGDMIDGWDETSSGLAAGNYFVRVEYSVTGVASNTTNATTELKYATPVMTIPATSTDVKKNRTKALLKANKYLADGKAVLYFDKYNGDVAFGPFDNLKELATDDTVTLSDVTDDTGTVNTDTKPNGLQSMYMVWDGLFNGTVASTSYEVGSTDFNNLITNLDSQIKLAPTAAPQVNNAMSTTNTSFIYNAAGKVKPMFNPHLNDADRSNRGLSTSSGNSKGRGMGYYEQRTLNPFLILDTTLFRMFTVKDAAKQPGESTHTIQLYNGNLTSGNANLRDQAIITFKNASSGAAQPFRRPGETATAATTAGRNYEFVIVNI